MPIFDAWDVVRVPFPYTNRSVRQRRPALVIHSGKHEGTPHLLWVLMITSAANRGWPGDVDVSDLAVSGLPAASIVRTAKIATIEASDAEEIGYLPLPDRPMVARHLRLALGRVSGEQ